MDQSDEGLSESPSEASTIRKIIDYMSTENRNSLERPKFYISSLCKQFLMKKRGLYDFFSTCSVFCACTKITNDCFLWYGLERIEETLEKLKIAAENELKAICDMKNLNDNYSHVFISGNSYDPSSNNGQIGNSMDYSIICSTNGDNGPHNNNFYSTESLNETEQAFKTMFNCSNDSSLGNITKKILELFLLLNERVLNLRSTAIFFAAGKMKYKTMLRKVYSVSAALEIIGLVGRTNKSAEIKLLIDLNHLTSMKSNKNQKIGIQSILNSKEELIEADIYEKRRQIYLSPNSYLRIKSDIVTNTTANNSTNALFCYNLNGLHSCNSLKTVNSMNKQSNVPMMNNLTFLHPIQMINPIQTVQQFHVMPNIPVMPAMQPIQVWTGPGVPVFVYQK